MFWINRRAWVNKLVHEADSLWIKCFQRTVAMKVLGGTRRLEWESVLMDSFSGGGPRYLKYIHLYEYQHSTPRTFYFFIFDGCQAWWPRHSGQSDHKSFFIFCFLLNANDVQFKIDPFKEFYALTFYPGFISILFNLDIFRWIFDDYFDHTQLLIWAKQDLRDISWSCHCQMWRSMIIVGASSSQGLSNQRSRDTTSDRHSASQWLSRFAAVSSERLGQKYPRSLIRKMFILWAPCWVASAFQL